MKSNRPPLLSPFGALLLLIASLLLMSCTQSLGPEGGDSSRTNQRVEVTRSPSTSHTVVVPLPAVPSPAPPDADRSAVITLSQPAYDTTETVLYTVTNQLDDPIYISEPDCSYGSVGGLQGEDIVPLRSHFFDRAVQFKHRIAAGESLGCTWGQEVFQDPSAEGTARFLNANRENGRRLAVPPGDYRVRLAYYLAEEDVGKPGKGQPIVSLPFTLSRAPFQEQLVIELQKAEYRLGEPIDYELRNPGEPSDWAGPIYLRGAGCGMPIVERSDGSPILAPAPDADGHKNRLSTRGGLCTLDPALWPEPVPETLPLAPGTYQIGLTYELGDSARPPGDWPRLVFSPPFTVTDVPLPDVAVTVEKAEYAPGEPVHLTIANSSEVPIYTYDNCGEPPVWWVSHNRIHRLVMRITEEWIPAQQLAPGESRACTWEQNAYQVLPGDDNYLCDGGCSVPPGTYQMRLHYYLSDPEEGSREDRRSAAPLTTVSRPFVITEP